MNRRLSAGRSFATGLTTFAATVLLIFVSHGGTAGMA